MLEITPAAANRMLTALLEVSEAGDECFRIVVTEEGAKLLQDEQQTHDVVFEHEQRVVLVMDPATAEFLKDEKIDYDEANSALVFA